MIGHLEIGGVMTYRWCYYEINLLGDPAVAFKPPFSGITPQGTPHWWLASYGWTNGFEAASLADADGDGLRAWQEYIAGTSPVDPRSVLRLAAFRGPGPTCVLRWPSVSDRVYELQRATDLVGGFSVLTNGLAATPPFNTFTDQTAAQGFYRVTVRLGP